MLQQPELRGFAIYHDGDTGHDEVLFCIVEFQLQAREHLIKVVNHLADRSTRHVYLLLPPRQALHKGGNPYFWHDDLPTIRTVGPILLPQSLQDAAWRQRELVHAYTDGMRNGVRHRGQGWNDGRFAHAPHPKGMIRIRHFHDHGIDHRQVQTRGHAIIQEARIDHVALLIEEILFIERPADTLHRTTLDLTLHVARVDRLASVLHCSVTQNRDLARLRIHFNIDNMRPHRSTGTGGVD